MMHKNVFVFAALTVLPANVAMGQAEPTPEALSPVACLRKIALDLTDHAPSEADLAALNSGTPLENFVDQYLETPEFKTIMFDTFRGKFPPTLLVPEDADREEPARIAHRAVVNNIDFREVVTGKYTVAKDGTVAASTSGDVAGVLSTQTYLSAYSGIENRNWAGQLLTGLTGVLLMAISEIPEGIDSSPSGLAANPACAGCHANPLHGVDYVAAFHSCYDVKGLFIEGCVPKETEFLGKKGTTLADLGAILASSPEWRAETIQSFHRLFWGRDIARNETPLYRRAERAWVEDGYRPHALIKHTVLSPEYCSR